MSFEQIGGFEQNVDKSPQNEAVAAFCDNLSEYNIGRFEEILEKYLQTCDT